MIAKEQCEITLIYSRLIKNCYLHYLLTLWSNEMNKWWNVWSMRAEQLECKHSHVRTAVNTCSVDELKKRELCVRVEIQVMLGEQQNHSILKAFVPEILFVSAMWRSLVCILYVFVLVLDQHISWCLLIKIIRIGGKITWEDHQCSCIHENLDFLFSNLVWFPLWNQVDFRFWLRQKVFCAGLVANLQLSWAYLSYRSCKTRVNTGPNVSF